jgi:transcriptional regulator with PAS, ATPase and Fis domain
LQFFLNETCKDAMNIMDFVDSIKLQLSDLEKVGKIGFVEGISSIIVKNLNSLDETKRPIHCTDSKREVMYIKDEDKWEKENEENKKLRKVIKHVAHKNSKLLPEFKKKYPNCDKSESKYSDKYDKLIIEAMGGKGDNDLEKEDKIIRNISKIVTIDKTNECN